MKREGLYIYRVMFIFRLGSTDYITCVGMDYIRKAMFVVNLYSPNDKLKLDYNTSHYPQDLIQYLKTEKEAIDSGFYSIRTWQMELYNKSSDEILSFFSKLRK
ncbi:hypothetical protein COA18_27925 [Priestia megaterium]|nr:hypothetical protein COA18_27925 [Priestia megaterium]